MVSKNPRCSIVLPCLNEEETLRACIEEIQSTFEREGIAGEIIVADNGSTDRSAQIARERRARVILIPEHGYGNALRGGIEAATGICVIMGDADMSYDFRDIPKFLKRLEKGDDLVMGNRFLGGIDRGAMPWSHRFIGNPLLSGIGRLFFRIPIGDMHCGLRGIRKTSYDRLNLKTTGMEFASEMIVRAALLRMKITEVPVRLRKDGRTKRSHLRTVRDGWRHLAFLLLLSPRWLFLYPGLALLLPSLLLFFWLLPHSRSLFGATLDIHTLLIAVLGIIAGLQWLTFGLITRGVATSMGIHPPSKLLARTLRTVSLERGLFLGGICMLTGFLFIAFPTFGWQQGGFSSLDPTETMREVIPALLLIFFGIQMISARFFLAAIALSSFSMNREDGNHSLLRQKR